MQRRAFLLPAIAILLAACAPNAAATETLAPTTTPTPFQASSATPTPDTVRVWQSPALPPDLMGPAAAVGSLSGRPVMQVARADAADLRLGPGETEAGANWTLALVAPFPTIADGMPLAAVQQLWRAGELGVLTGTAGAVEQLLGAGSPAMAGAVEDVIDWTWESGAMALVPFDQLDPRWKVLAVDGRSPLDVPYERNSYPLQLSFGVSGEPELAAAMRAALAWPATNRDPDKLTVVAVTGVTALTRATAWAIERESIAWAVAEVQPWLLSADITHISHEVAFTPDCPPVNPSRDVSRFCGQPYQIEVLESIGADVIELTGNHVLDYGAEALAFTLDAYDERGWQTYGGGRDLTSSRLPARFEHNGHTITFFGCNPAGPSYAWATELQPGSAPCDMESLLAEISAEREAGGLPIVTFQWPESYRNWPLPPQQQAFRQAAEAGAVIVSGSQAHQAQGLEFHQGSLIHYGLGNLFFDQMWSEPTRQEFVDVHVFYDGRHVSTVLHTAMLEDYARPRPMTEGERTAFLQSIFDASGW